MCRLISIHVLRMEDDSCCFSLPFVYRYFNPRPPHGGRRTEAWEENTALVISIHVLRMEDDNRRDYERWREEQFQSTPSAWRTTNMNRHYARWSKISIHALRMEDDPLLLPRLFYTCLFQSTSSAWRTTCDHPIQAGP